MNLRRYDLNLLPVLETLIKRGNVTRAGQDLGLSQSATSHALMRLRQQLGDELLRFSGREGHLTPRAQAMSAPLRGALELLEQLLDLKQFDPAKSSRTFTLLTADYMGALVLPKLLKRLDTEGPSININVTWGRGNIAEALHANELDVALTPQSHAMHPDIRSEAVFWDEMVVVASAANSEIGETLDYATFQRLPHVVFRMDGGGALLSFADIQIIRHGVEYRKTVSVPNFLLLPLIVAESRCVALTHRSLAERMRSMAKIRILAPPFPAEKVEICTLWSRTMDFDSGHRWFRQVLKEVCAEIGSTPVPVHRRPTQKKQGTGGSTPRTPVSARRSKA